MRLALLSNVTVEVLAGMLGKEHALWLAPGFGAWMETALAVPADLKAFDPEAVFLLLDASHATYDPAAVATAAAALEAALPHATVIVPDLADLADGTGDFYDERMWTLGALPWSMAGLRAIRDEIGRLLGLMRGGRKKVLALDLDNTLWRGVIGEDGVAGIAPFAGLQREIRALKERGVLLVALSRNNAADVEPVWDDPRMVLKRTDFADLRLDWNDKPANLAAAAQALNLGTDSFVFLDDNPAERARMRACRPEVAVPDWPAPLRRIARLHFPAFRVTAEDRAKTEQYRAEAARRQFAEGLALADYLKGLELWADVHPARPEELPRVAQLAQKTNQFNVCTNRYTLEEVARRAADPQCLLWTVHAGDRFGDQGLVAFVCAELEGAAARLTDWVMSCRAMNRRLEFAVQAACEKTLAEKGVRKLSATWHRTAKNAPVAELFDRFGFARTAETDDRRRYELTLPRTAALEHSITYKGT